MAEVQEEKDEVITDKQEAPAEEPKKPQKANKELEALKAKLAQAQEALEQAKLEIEEQKDRALRTAAEYDNFRKRSIKEREGLYVEIKAKTVAEFLPVIDNLERAVADESGQLEQYKKGVEMTYSGLSALLEKLGVEPVGEVGEPFDPEVHNAVMHTEDDSLGENVITQVLQKGYRIGGKVIRPAMVQVAN